MLDNQEEAQKMKKTIFSLAALLTTVIFANVAMAVPNDTRTYHQHFNSSYNMPMQPPMNNPPPHHHGHHNPPPPRHHHGHHTPPPPPMYSNYYAPMVPVNQVVSVNYPYGNYYFSTPYYTYPYGYYPNKTLTVRTKHVLFSI